jgi:7-keto-8-aminopelargonate synthetase-like enzyme
LSGGKIERFRHNDMDHLERVLKSLPEDPANCWLLTVI